MTTHAAINALRKRARQPEAKAEEWVEEEHPEVAEPASVYGLKARIDELMQTLPEAQRVAVALRYCEGMWPEEIARVLSQPVATVKSNLQRGLGLLRRKAAVTLKEYVREQA